MGWRQLVFLFIGTLGSMLAAFASPRQPASFWPFWTEERTKKEREIRCYHPFHGWTQAPHVTNFYLRPFSWQQDRTDLKRAYFLYPLGWSQKKKDCLEWHLLGGLVHSEWRQEERGSLRSFELWPLYFLKKGFGRSNDYQALFPLGGRIKNFFGRDEIAWCPWPLFVQTRREDEINRWYPWPFFNRRSGEAIKGFGFWPLGGHFWKSHCYDERYFLWPFFYTHEHRTKENGIKLKKGFLPFYAYESSANMQDLSIIWPIWGRRSEKDPRYEEHRILWPFFVQGRGKKRFINRWAPFRTHSIQNGCEKRWYMWPFVRQLKWEEKSLLFHQEQFLYFLFWTQTQRSKDGLFYAEKSHFWPIYSYWNNGQGRIQFQMFSPFEVFFPTNEAVRNLYTPLFAFYRFSQDSENGRKQSVLFDFIREKKTEKSKYLEIAFLLRYLRKPGHGEFELLKGLLGYRCSGEEKTFKFFWKTFKSVSGARKKLLNPRSL